MKMNGLTRFIKTRWERKEKEHGRERDTKLTRADNLKDQEDGPKEYLKNAEEKIRPIHKQGILSPNS